MTEKEIKHFVDSVAHEIIKTAIYTRITGSQAFGNLGLELTFEQYIALDTISANPNICQRDLSKLILKDRSNTGRILNILEENGFVERTIETKNKRLVKNVIISPKGQKILNENDTKIREKFSNIFEEITEEELSTLRTLLIKFRHSLSAGTSLQI